MNLMTPLSGILIPLDQVPDPVFSQGFLGKGFGIDPTDNTVFAPCDGVVAMIHPSQHALTIKAENGAEILIHIGIDTVKLKGQGFQVLVTENQQIKQGAALVRIDADFIAENATSLISIFAVTNSDQFQIEFEKQVVPHRLVENTISLLSFRKNDSTIICNSTDSVANSAVVTANQEHISRLKVKVDLESGLHARPAALIVAAAKNFVGNVKIYKELKSSPLLANAKSVTSLLALQIQKGDSVYIEASGAQNQQIVSEIASLLSKNAPESKKEVQTQKQSQRATDVETLYLSKENTNVFTGVLASPGKTLGKILQARFSSLDNVFSYSFTHETSGESDAASLEDTSRPGAEQVSEKEKQILLSAVEIFKDNLKSQTKTFANEVAAQILEAHLLISEDPEILDFALTLTKTKRASDAWIISIRKQISVIKNLNNTFLAERSKDIQEVGEGVLEIILRMEMSGDPLNARLDGFEKEKLILTEPAIIICRTLSPSNLMQLPQQFVSGIVTVEGTKNSHLSILAKSLGIPYLTQVDEEVLNLQNGFFASIDWADSKKRGNLNASGILKTQLKLAEVESIHSEILKNQTDYKNLCEKSKGVCFTKDGRSVEVAANLSSIKVPTSFTDVGADGIGLVRTELLFQNHRTPPTSEEQLSIYQSILDQAPSQNVIFRVWDVGGDKPVLFMPLEKEENPFLGLRGLRVCFRYENIFRTQIKALLSLKSARGVKILLPMVSSFQEIQKAKKIIQEEQFKMGHPSFQMGIMIETPASAMMTAMWSQEVDFFSIGSNDLTQYTLALDRNLSAQQEQSPDQHFELGTEMGLDEYNPAVLRSIANAVAGAKQKGKWIGLCGNLASDMRILPFLVGTGIDELSVSLKEVPELKNQIRSLNFETCQKLAHQILSFAQSSNDVKEMLKIKESL